MKIATLGSRIIDDAVVSSKAGNHNDNIKRIVGISLFSINSDSLFNKNERWNIKEKNSYCKNILTMDLNKSIMQILAKTRYERLFIDFADSAGDIWQCTLTDGRIFRCTYNDIFRNNITYIKESIIAKSKCSIKNEVIIKPLEWNDAELTAEVTRLASELLALDVSRTVLFNPYIPFRYKVDNSINNSPFPQKVSDINAFSERCFKKLCDIMHCQMINRTDFVLGGSRYNDVGGLSYTQEYYDYLNRCVDSAQTAELENTYIHQLQSSVEMCLLNNNSNKIKTLNGSRKLILICESEEVYDYCKEELCIPCTSYIKYSDAVTKKQCLCHKLSKLHGKYDEYFIVIAHLTRDSAILKLLWEIGFTQPFGCYVPSADEFCLNNFKGSFSDIYHNMATIKSEHVQAHFSAHASEITIHENCNFNQRLLAFVRNSSVLTFGKDIRADKLSTSCFDCSEISIGDSSTFADNCFIVTGTPFTNIDIGRDCMFSSKITCLGGDGHAIFDIDSGDRINLNPDNVRSGKLSINIGSHVWVGYQAFIMSGADIGSGTVIGARTLVSKPIPNNVIAAGKPAAVIKKDVTWRRDPFSHNIYDNPDSLEAEFIKRTGE